MHGKTLMFFIILNNLIIQVSLVIRDVDVARFFLPKNIISSWFLHKKHFYHAFIKKLFTNDMKFPFFSYNQNL